VLTIRNIDLFGQSWLDDMEWAWWNRIACKIIGKSMDGILSDISEKNRNKRRFEQKKMLR
jgi:hypothetical protein